MRETIRHLPCPALTDQQTGLPNTLHFDTVFEVTFAAAKRALRGAQARARGQMELVR